MHRRKIEMVLYTRLLTRSHFQSLEKTRSCISTRNNPRISRNGVEQLCRQVNIALGYTDNYHAMSIWQTHKQHSFPKTENFGVAFQMLREFIWLTPSRAILVETCFINWTNKAYSFPWKSKNKMINVSEPLFTKTDAHSASFIFLENRRHRSLITLTSYVTSNTP